MTNKIFNPAVFAEEVKLLRIRELREALNPIASKQEHTPSNSLTITYPSPAVF